MTVHLPTPSLLPPLIPDNAPFTPEQRAWLNGFFAGILNLDQMAGGAAATALAGIPVPAADAPASDVLEPDADAPWHDPALELPERMDLAKERNAPSKLMAAMGQLDCGQCGYDCRAYASVLFKGEEKKLNLCVPGGKATQRMLKQIIAGTGEAKAPAAAKAELPPVAPSGRAEAAMARFLAAEPLNAADSEKDTRHVVIDLNGTGVVYEPGDSLGVLPANDPELAQAICAALGASPETEIGDGNGHAQSLVDALVDTRDLRAPGEAFFALLARAARDPAEAAALKRLAEDDDPVGDMDDLDVLDVLARYPSARPAPKALVESLDELQPRLYSIASSPRAHPGEVHLTIGVSREVKRGRLRRGVASTFLAERMAAGAPLRVYRQAAHGFALPEGDTTPIVMVGPGTGIAPFRAFLQERAARGAPGKAWLFFGNPYGEKDFLYREQLADLKAKGTLTRLDTAFSRDQAEKVYVQHRLIEQGAELWHWLEEGAHVYVCGDAKRMAADVDRALQEVVRVHGERDGKAYLAELAKDGRYQRDVY